MDIIEKYPFLSVGDGEYSWFDSIPDGWQKAFGKQMCEDIARVLRKADFLYDYEIMDVKEKYGELRWYDGGVPEEIYDELQDVIDKYTELSRKTCIVCGAPATKISKGWIAPYCDECYVD